MKELRIKFDDSISDRKAIYLVDSMIRDKAEINVEGNIEYPKELFFDVDGKPYKVCHNDKRKTIFFKVKEEK